MSPESGAPTLSWLGMGLAFLLALVPLIDAGPGQDSDCVQWLQGKK